MATPQENLKICKEDLLLSLTLDLEDRDRGESVAEWLKERREHLFRKALGRNESYRSIEGE